MLKLKDYSLTTILRSKLLTEEQGLNALDGKTIEDLLKEHKDLLIYPYSFEGKARDNLSKKTILKLENKTDTSFDVRSYNIAGFLGFGNLNFKIQSRFCSNDNDDFFLHYLLAKVLDYNLINLPHPSSKNNILDFLALLFPYYLDKALKQGFYHEYQRIECNNDRVKGQIDLSRHIKLNIPFQGKIAYNCDLYSQDNRVTELIRHTYEFLNSKSCYQGLFKKTTVARQISQLIEITENYRPQDRALIIKRNLKAPLHPYYTQYLPLWRLCLKILKHEKIKFQDQGKAIVGFLFDIAELWEEYLATLLVPKGFIHPNNRKETGYITLGTNGNWRRYPDFYFENDPVIVIDAKYKWGITKEDQNQIIAYMYRLKAKRGIFVLPKAQNTFDANYQNRQIKLLGYGEDLGSTSETFYLTIPQGAQNYEEFSNLMQQEEANFLSYLNLK